MRPTPTRFRDPGLIYKGSWVGLHPLVEAQRYPEVARQDGLSRVTTDPDELMYSRPPAEVQSELEDVFGDLVRGKRPRIKLRMHPWFKRWALYQESRNPETGENTWHAFWICGLREPRKGPKGPGYLPPDLAEAHDKRYEPLRGRIEDYRLPNKEEFGVLFEKFNVQRTTIEQRRKHHQEERTESDRAWKSHWEGFTRDLCGYNFHSHVNWTNQRAGSGQHLQSFGDVTLNRFKDGRLTSESGNWNVNTVTVDESRGEAGKYHTIERREAWQRDIERTAKTAMSQVEEHRAAFQHLLEGAQRMLHEHAPEHAPAPAPEVVHEHVHVEVEAAK